MEQKDQQILFELGPDILRELNIEAIQPYLSKYGLTASEELDILLHDSTTNTAKKKKLIYSWLPQKGNDCLRKFIEALKESSEGTSHNDLAMRLQAKRAEDGSYTQCDNAHDDCNNLDSGVDAASSTILTESHVQTSSQDLSSSSVCSGLQEGNLSPTSDVFSNGQYELVSSDSDAEEDNLRDTLQKKYTRVMGPSGVAKIANKIPIEEFRLFCFNITRTSEDYRRMSNESLRSPEIWCRVSMNCNYCHFSPLESICQHFANGCQEFIKLVEEYKKSLADKMFKTICLKTKPNEGYQSVSEPKELFAACVVNIAITLHERVLKKKLCLDDMKSYFCTLKISSVDHEQELLITSTNIQNNINKAKDVFFLLFAVSPCWDCINFLFFEEHVVKQFGGDDEKKELESYKRHLKNRWLMRPVEEYPNMTAELTCFRHLHQIKCRINAEWDTTKINQVLKLKKVVASVYDVDLSVVKLLKTSKGSVIIYFALPSVCNKELHDEHILLLAKHDFLELAVYDLDGPDKDKAAIISYDITERFNALDNLLASSVQSDDNELRSEVLLFERVTKSECTSPSLLHDLPARKIFKHWAKHFIVLQTFTTSSRLDIYHNASNYAHGKSPIDSRTLYGIDIQMRSEKKKPYILMIINQNSSLSMSFNKHTEAQEWFIALTHVIGCFHLHLKMHPPHHHIPEDLVVKLKGNSIIFWSLLDQNECMDWQLCDIIAVSLNKALYIRVRNASYSNNTLKEGLFVFEGQQLEKLFDLLEEKLSSVVKHKSCLSAALDTTKDSESNPTYSFHQGGTESAKRMWSSETLTSEESGSTDNLSINNYQKYDILSEIFSAEPVSTTYNAFSWKVKGEIRLQDKVIQLVKSSWFSVISKYILNRGYRIIVTLPDQQTKILAQEKNDSEGKRRIQEIWKVIQALQKAHTVLKHPSCTQETGHFQTEVMIVEASEILVHDSSLCHFQNVYYGTVKKHPMFGPAKNGLHTGIAQCTIPPAQLAEMYSNLYGKRFQFKLWPSSSALQTSISVNYQNEIEPHKFKETLNGSLFPSQYASLCTEAEILLYIPCSSQCFDETVMIQASQLAVNLGFPDKVVVFEWCTEKNMDCIWHVMEEAKPRLLQFLEVLCSCSTKVHIIAVNDGALLLVQSSMKFEHKLGQVILTKLHKLSQYIFAGLKEMEQTSNSLLLQAENITIYHKPKPLQKSLSLTQGSILGRSHDIFFKKFSLEPPPFIKHVDIICLESGNPDNYLIKNHAYATSKVVIDDMSEIICFGKSIVDRSSRIKLQCSCSELRRPIFRSHLPCMICSRCSNFVMNHVAGLGNFTPAVLESFHEGYDMDKKNSSIRKGLQLEGLLSHQYQNKNSTLVTKSAP